MDQLEYIEDLCNAVNVCKNEAVVVTVVVILASSLAYCNAFRNTQHNNMPGMEEVEYRWINIYMPIH